MLLLCLADARDDWLIFSSVTHELTLHTTLSIQRDAIGIVYSKALGGSNPYGDGRGIFDVGRGAYR